ncbi:hypothetical protein RRF57_007644 [Xylaria bambusicola]|uniref:Uncharacterized protein n=1 Tax=Xylaria bambusicola TaxID=326684 RepID=A0AAN7UGJ2_9PEZI
MRKKPRSKLARNPGPSSCKSRTPWSSLLMGSLSPPTSPGSMCGSGSARTLRRVPTRRYSTHPLPRHSRIRTAALTLVPMMPPTYWKPSKRSRRAPAVAATTMHIMMMMVEWPREKNVPTVTGRWPDATRRRVIRSMAAMWSASKA